MFNKGWIKALAVIIAGILIYIIVDAIIVYQNLSATVDMIVYNKNVDEAAARLKAYPRRTPIFMDGVISYRVLPPTRMLDKIFEYPPERSERKKIDDMLNGLFEKRGPEENLKRDIKQASYLKDDSTFKRIWDSTTASIINRDKRDIIDSVYSKIVAMRSLETTVKRRGLDVYLNIVQNLPPEDIEKLKKAIVFHARRICIINASNNFDPQVRKKAWALRKLLSL